MKIDTIEFEPLLNAMLALVYDVADPSEKDPKTVAPDTGLPAPYPPPANI
jgi:hypothetical protein